jgi:hypothetical protein
MKSKKSSQKFTESSSNIFSNKYVLYISFFFAIVTVANYLLRNNLEAVGIFIIIGFLTTYFSKNMIIVLLTTTVITNFLVMFKNKGYSMMRRFQNREGLENENAPKSESIQVLKATTDAAEVAMNKETNPDKKSALKKVYDESKQKYDAAVKEEDSKSKANAASSNPASGSENTVSMGTIPANEVAKPLAASGGAGAGAKKDGMTQLRPASVNAESIDPMIQAPGMAKGANAQKEQAYNMMSSLGGGGDMMSQQTEMINNLKSIEPILNTAQNFLDKFENSSISKMFSGGGFPGMSLLTGGGANKANPAPVSA